MDGARVLAIFLDGYESSLEDEMRAAGELPHLDALAARSCAAALDHGSARRTGLAGEHVSTGKNPEAMGRYAAVEFDPDTYLARQVGTRSPTFVGDLGVPSVVFDVPYFDLASTPNADGLVNWGAHDPGVAATCRPDGLADELDELVGPYPGTSHLYATPWPSPDGCRQMGETLVASVEARTRASLWLLGERLPDWRFAMVSVSECHSGIEGLWHGVDPDHRLAGVASAVEAGRALRAVYRSIDDLVGAHVDAFPDATVVVFSMHGMGANMSDVASMALLPELLHRWCGGAARLRPPRRWTDDPTLAPSMPDDASWTSVVRTASRPGRRACAQARLRRSIERGRRPGGAESGPDPASLSWMPAQSYADRWSQMDAFALPSFYDGRVRVNLVGREASGRVAPDRYDEVLDEIEDLARTCVDPFTGRSAVADIERPARLRDVDPTELGRTEADLCIVWNGPLALDHPELGLIGPLPFRRTGGHSRPDGSLRIAGDGIRAGDLGRISVFNVVPSFFDLLGLEQPATLSGRAVATR